MKKEIQQEGIFAFAILEAIICCECYRKTLQDPQNFLDCGAIPLYRENLENPEDMECCEFCHEELTPDLQ